MVLLKVFFIGMCEECPFKAHGTFNSMTHSLKISCYLGKS